MLHMFKICSLYLKKAGLASRNIDIASKKFVLPWGDPENSDLRRQPRFQGLFSGLGIGVGWTPKTKTSKNQTPENK